MGNSTFNLPFTLGVPDTPSLDFQDPRVRALAEELYNAFQQLQLALHNYLGVGQQLQTLWSSLSHISTLHQASQFRIYKEATEDIIYGAAINLFSSGGVIKMRNANATNNTKPCHGFCMVAGGVTSGNFGEAILFCGLLTGFAGLTVGSRYFLSTSNGLLTAVAPVAAGNIEQALGIALDSGTLLYQFTTHFIQH